MGTNKYSNEDPFLVTERMGEEGGGYYADGHFNQEGLYTGGESGYQDLGDQNYDTTGQFGEFGQAGEFGTGEYENNNEYRWDQPAGVANGS